MSFNKIGKVLVIYTGGTIGMVRGADGSLRPFAMDHIYEEVPILRKASYTVDCCQLDNIIDSSNMSPSFWVDIVNIIEREYEHYDGFVVLHGTDTMAYTASALSFMLENLSKPVVLTGSQLPLDMMRSDGRDNIVAALEIASAQQDVPTPEVMIFFEDHLYRGNRSTKVSAENFDAFSSYNYPSLARVGINISFKGHLLLPMPKGELIVHKTFDERIAVLKLFPGITPAVVESLLNSPGLRGAIIETYGSGNAPTEDWFINAIQRAIERGVVVLDVTQCKAGAVKLCQYAASCDLDRIGVIGGHDITIEAAVTKMMYLLGHCGDDTEEVKRLLGQSIRGEISL